MLPASHRLRRPDQFRAVGRRGSRAGRGTLVVHVLTGRPDDAAQVGFTVGRAVGTAVVRNRVRRRLRHAAAELLASSCSVLADGDQVVVRATPAAAGASYAVLRDDLRSGLERARSRTTRTPRATP